VQTWFHTEPVPTELLSALRNSDCIVVAHNAAFERLMMRDVLKWPTPPLDRWDDTAARAARQALPRSLDGAASALGLGFQKDIEGKSLMMRMCRPRKVEDDGTIKWWNDADRMQRLAQYCATDVEVERELDKVLRPLSPTEKAIWMLTEEINDLGVPVDVDFAKYAIDMAVKEQMRLNEKLQAITGGDVSTITNVIAMKSWLAKQGFGFFEGQDEGLNKKAVDNLLAMNLPDNVRTVLQIRKSGGKSSVAKYQAVVDRASSDGRVRGNLMYHGASTGRWAGAGVQLQNLPRETVKDWQWSRDNLPEVPDRLSTLSRMIRGTIRSGQGRLMWGDYASVEARGVAWLAGQKDLVQLFASGGKIYEEMAGVIFNTPPTEIGKDSLERFIGKTTVLGCGYSMGAQKFRQSCAAMGTDIDEELAQRAVQTYRSSFPKIPQLWRGLEDAAVAAVEQRGVSTKYRSVQFYSDGDWLYIRLPSGRKLFYRGPRIVTHAGPFGAKPAIEYMAVNSLTKKWNSERTYGGKLTENIVQGICRDLIAHAMLALRDAGFPVIASVHDEVVCEVTDERTKEQMLEIMCAVPEWAKDFPLAADAKEGVRYGK
jgi:DNA polymerase